jgi:hypothetical protein
MNDGRYAEYFDDVFTDSSRDVDALLDKIEGCGATAVLMTPTMFDARAKRMQPPGGFMGPKAVTFYNATLAYYGAWLRDTAYERGFRFVDLWGPLNAVTFRERQRDPAFTMVRDSAHSDAPAQVVMAAAIVADLNLPRLVSETTLTYYEQGRRRRPRVGSDRGEAQRLAAQINAQLASGAPAALSFESVPVLSCRAAGTLALAPRVRAVVFRPYGRLLLAFVPRQSGERDSCRLFRTEAGANQRPLGHFDFDWASRVLRYAACVQGCRARRYPESATVRSKGKIRSETNHGFLIG